MKPEPQDGIIRITKEEALGSHVDDLLKRQMSLRGEAGVTRDHGRRWYYQNWVVFGLVGLLGAVAAWGILEPHFDDLLYLQGPVSAIDLEDHLPGRIDLGQRYLQLQAEGQGSITINGQKIHLLQGIKEIHPDGASERLDPAALKEGETVGVYLDYFDLADRELALASFLRRAPPEQSPARARLTLDQIESRLTAAGLLLFPLVAGLIGLSIGAVDGLVCRLPRRALLGGTVGLLVGMVGGFVSSMAASIAYAPLNQLAMKQAGEGVAALSTLGFSLQLLGRSLAWAMAGLAMGLGQGIALRSKRLFLYGVLGGIVGGLLGGLLFDPIDLILLGPDKPSAHWSRLIGFAVIGISVGGMIGLVELLARDAWLRMTQGPLTGKEFLLFKDVMNVGSSPRSDIYLFNDPMVTAHHATIRAVGDQCEIEARQSTRPVLLNNRTVVRARLRHGDHVAIGGTVFVFQQRKS